MTAPLAPPNPDLPVYVPERELPSWMAQYGLRETTPLVPDLGPRFAPPPWWRRWLGRG